MTAIRIVLADDFAPWRQIVRSILDGIPGVCVVAEASDGQEAAQKAETLLPDIVLLDISMPVLNGIEAAKRIKQSCPKSKVIFLTQQNDDDVKSIALATGAEAYLSKSAAASELRPVVEAAMFNGPEAHGPIPPPPNGCPDVLDLRVEPPRWDRVSSLSKPFPITAITLAVVVGAWTFYHLMQFVAFDLAGERPHSIEQSPPFESPNLPSGIHRLYKRPEGITTRAATLSAFKRVRVGSNEVDYVTEDVTMRVFTVRPVKGHVQHMEREVHIGDDVTVRYFACGFCDTSQARRPPAIGMSVERSSPASK